MTRKKRSESCDGSTDTNRREKRGKEREGRRQHRFLSLSVSCVSLVFLCLGQWIVNQVEEEKQDRFSSASLSCQSLSVLVPLSTLFQEKTRRWIDEHGAERAGERERDRESVCGTGDGPRSDLFWRRRRGKKETWRSIGGIAASRGTSSERVSLMPLYDELFR